MDDGPYEVLRATPGRGHGLPEPRGGDLLRAFSAISRALNLGQPLSLTLDLIAEKVSQTMGHMYCAIYLLDHETEELHIEGSHGLSEEYVRRLNSDLVQRVDGDGERSATVTVTAFRSRMPMYVADITKDPRFGLAREMIVEAGYNSVVSLPLVFRGEAIGVLNCYDRHRDYSEEQVEALVAVAEQAASAVGVARLMIEQQQTIDQLDGLYRRAAAQHALLRRSEEIHEALAAILLEDRSLHEITGALSERLRVPVVLQDDRLEVLSRAAAQGSAFAGIPAGEANRGPVDSGIARLREAGRAIRIGLGPAEGTRIDVVASRVVAGGELFGYLSVPLEDAAEEEPYRRALEEAATVYALYMMRRRAAQEAEARVRGDLLMDLLAGQPKSGDEMRERCRYLGVDFASAAYRIVLVKLGPSPSASAEEPPGSRGGGQARGKLVAAVRAFSHRFGPGAAAAMGGHASFLVADGDGFRARGAADRLLALVAEEVPAVSVRVGVSGACRCPADFALRYAETVALVELAARLESTEGAIFFDDWEVYGLLLKSSDPEDLLMLARRALAPLLAQDRDGQLLATLQAYVEGGLSLNRAAEALYAHVNTVRYRMRKISGALGRDLGDLDQVLKIKIALMIRNLNPNGFDRAEP